MYLDAFGQQFTGVHGLAKRKRFLERFVRFLKKRGHSMKLARLTFEDGQEFLDSIIHAYRRGQMSPQTKERYKSALRGFSRFSATSELVHGDLFFAITVG